VGSRRYAAAVSQRYFTSNPYFNGFQTTASSGGSAPPPTYHVAPYEESASVPGQWDKHAIGLDYAFAYSQANNGSGVSNANALGSSTVKVAIIDTGEDATHPLLKAKIAYKRCFITNLNGSQSTSNYVADPEGHGTDTSGIAAADSTVSLGFVGSGGAAEIYAYRVFPTPDDNCVNPASTDEQCGADSSDIASAIEDAIAQNVNVISMSLGGGTCSNGVDSDPVEGNAIADAIAANVVVIASSGNTGASSVTAPACDSGVIAVGASALADGQRNGSGTAGGSASTPMEYVASYSNYGSPAAQVGSSSAWGIVAPGGDPNGDTDSDNFHWIENIWTSTPYDSNFAGSCTPDYPGTGSTADCRTLIAGTSMSAASASGAAALILSVNSTYQSSAKMKQLLCTTADDISAANEGCGRLDIYRAMANVLGDPHPPTSSM
jgi:subtilisin family serine protease